MGYLKQLPPPDAINDEWEGNRGVKEELEEYLCSTIRHLNLSTKGLTLEVMLCMACETSQTQALLQVEARLRKPSERHVILRPTVLILCSSRRTRSAIKDRLRSKADGLARFNRFLEANGMKPPVVSRPAPRPAVNTSEFLPRDPRLDSGKISFALSDKASLCGIPARSSSRTTDYTEAIFTIGGAIRLGDSLYGLTTGHSFVNNESKNSESDESDESSDSDDEMPFHSGEGLQSNSDEGQNTNANANNANGVNEEFLERLNCMHEWKQTSFPRVLAYKGRGTKNGDFSLPEPAPDGSDFALVTMPILDFGRRTLGYHGAKRSVTGVAPSHELQEGSVEILYDMRRPPGHSEPLEAHPPKAKSSIILGSSIMSTRKIQMPVDSKSTYIPSSYFRPGVSRQLYLSQPKGFREHGSFRSRNYAG